MALDDYENLPAIDLLPGEPLLKYYPNLPRIELVTVESYPMPNRRGKCNRMTDGRLCEAPADWEVQDEEVRYRYPRCCTAHLPELIGDGDRYVLLRTPNELPDYRPPAEPFPLQRKDRVPA